MDPNKAYIPFDPFEDEDATRRQAERVRQIGVAVRRAIRILNTPERNVIEGYYFDGTSFPRLANAAGVTLTRIRTIHERALAKLRTRLTPFVELMFGLRVIQAPDCPICSAMWREIAEDLLDAKTTDMTWGDVARRLERAVGWRAPTPQILMTHQRKHRALTRTDKYI